LNRTRRKISILVVVAAAVVSLVVVLALVPLGTRAFSGVVTNLWCGGCSQNPASFNIYQVTFPTNSAVAFSWESVSNQEVELDVLGPGTSATSGPCLQVGSSGSCSFTASGGIYWFWLNIHGPNETAIAASYAGTYTAPIL
jgi:hypothetical protein